MSENEKLLGTIDQEAGTTATVNDQIQYKSLKGLEDRYANSKYETLDIPRLSATATVYIYKTDLIDAQYDTYNSASDYTRMLIIRRYR